MLWDRKGVPFSKVTSTLTATAQTEIKTFM